MNAIKHREVPAAITQLRAEIEQLPKDKGGKRQGIPEELKRRAVATLLASGKRPGKFASAISVSHVTIGKWRLQFGAAGKVSKDVPIGGPGFQKLSVTPEPMPSGRALTIEGPNGMKITGLGTEDVVRLWRALC